MQIRYTKDDVQKWKDSLNTLPARILAKQNEITLKTAEYNALESSLLELKQNKIPAKKLLIEKFNAKIELIDLPAQIVSISKEMSTLLTQLTALDQPIANLFAEIKPIEDEINYTNKLLTIKKLKADIAEAEIRIESLHRAKQLDEQELVSVRHTYTNQSKNLIDNQHTLTSLQEGKEELVRRLEILRHNEANDGFTSSVGDVSGFTSSVSYTIHNPEIANVETQLADYEVRIASCRMRVQQSQSQVDHLNSQLTRLERKMDDDRQELRNIERKVYSCTINLNSHSSLDLSEAASKSVDQLNQRLSSNKATLQTLQDRLNGLRQNQSSLKYKYDVASRNEANLRKTKAAHEELIKDFSETGSHAELQAKLADEENNLKSLTAEKQRIENIDRDIQADKKRLKELKNELDSCINNAYLQALDKNPQQLLDKLTMDLYREIDEYEMNHPSGQEGMVRKCLAELKHKIPSLLGLLTQEKADDDKEVNRKKYYALCGFIKHWQSKTSDFTFSGVLSSVLSSHYIDLTEARNDFKDIRNVNPNELNDINDMDLLTYEANVYAAAYANFKSIIDKVNGAALPELLEVKNAGLALLIEMKEKEDKAKNDFKPFDYKYYTSVLNLAGCLLAEPNNRGLHKAFRDLVAHTKNEDRPSIGYKIGGAALMFLGAVIAAAGAVVAFLGFPIGAPLYCTVPMMVAGAALLATGIGLFGYGFKKGLAGKLNEFDKKVDLHQAEIMASESKPLTAPGSYNLSL